MKSFGHEKGPKCTQNEVFHTLLKIDALTEAVVQMCSVKKGALRNFTKFTGKHLCQSLFFRPEACNFIKKEALAQVFSCEFCEIFKNTFFQRTPPVATSALSYSEFLHEIKAA